MVRYFKKTCPERERAISYQDLDVHQGTIYKAAGWKVGYVSKPRVRDRSKKRVGTDRMYRTNKNGIEPDAAGKARWEISLENAIAEGRAESATSPKQTNSPL
jgi:hypothetical protein